MKIRRRQEAAGTLAINIFAKLRPTAWINLDRPEIISAVAEIVYQNYVELTLGTICGTLSVLNGIERVPIEPVQALWRLT